jgi:tripartite-type tricarboxylate transporter receptor subunit TctC
MREGLALLALTCTLAAPAATLAQAYPANRPIRIVVPNAPGGGADLVARILSGRLTERLGQPVVVDNRGAAGGIVGAEITAKSAPDGHTLMVAVNTHVANPWLFSKLPFDALRDFAPVTLAVQSPLVAIIQSSHPSQNLQEFLAWMRANPGKTNFGSSGTGSPPHLAGELFKSLGKVDMTHVVYKGIGPALTSLMGGEIQITFGNVFVTLPHVRSGRLRVLGISTAKRSEAVPDWPTLAEAGLPGYEASIWFGIMVPGKTPSATIARLHREITGILNLPEVRQQINASGGDVIAGTTEEFAREILREHERLGRIIRAAGIKVE